MSLVLQPGNSFTVVRQIANHLDSNTNYVQAVIRNAYTDAIIDTLQLTDKGSQRFSKNWQVPADPSGQGFFISIVTSVYTDSGYTTKNADYGDDENTYLVQERVLRGGGGGVDAFTVRKIVQEELGKIEIPKPLPFPELPEPIDRTDEVLKAIQGIEIPEPAKIVPTDLKPLSTKLDTILKAITEKPVTPVTDLTPILNEFKSIDAYIDDSVVNKILRVVAEGVTDAVSKMNFVTSFITHASSGVKPPEEKTPPPTEPPKTVPLTDLAV